MALFPASSGSEENIVVGVEKKTGTITIGGTTYTTYKKIVDMGAGTANVDTTKNESTSFTGVLSCIATAMTAYSSFTYTLASSSGPYVFFNSTTITVKPHISVDKILVIVEYYR